MRYRNKSRHKMLLQLEDGVKEVYPNEEFDSSENLAYSFLEEIKPKTKPKPKPKVIIKSKSKKQTTLKETLDVSDNPKA